MTEPSTTTSAYQRAVRRRRIEAIAYPAGALLVCLGLWQLVIIIFHMIKAGLFQRRSGLQQTTILSGG